MASPVVELTVFPIPSTRSTPARRRQITPSAEAGSPKHSLILTTPRHKPGNLLSGGVVSTRPFFGPRQLFPDGAASVHNIGNLHDQPHRLDTAVPTPNTGKHVLLPFDLRDPTILLEHEDIRPVLYNVFPGTHNVCAGRNRSFLLFQVDKLPEKPWPLTVGGLPIVICDDMEGRGVLFPKQILAPFTNSIIPHFGDRDLSSGEVLRDLAREVNMFFTEALPRVQLLELICTTERAFYAILANDVDISAIYRQLPGKIANCTVGYMRDEEIGRPHWADMPARRLINPQAAQGIIDDTFYDIMRPGVIVSSQTLKDHAPPSWFPTTSGVEWRIQQATVS